MTVFVFGTSIWARDQMLALKNLGINVISLKLDLRSIRRLRRLGYYESIEYGIKTFTLSIPVGRVPLCVSDFIGRHAASYLFSMAVSKVGRPDVVHAHFAEIARFLLPAKEKYKFKFVVTEHGSAIMDESSRKRLNKYLRKTYMACDQVIVVSSALGHVLEVEYGIKSHVIPNIVNTDYFYFRSRNRNTNNFIFVSVGNLIYRKGFDILVSAFGEAFNGNPKIKLKIIGGGKKIQKSLLKQITASGLTDVILLEGAKTREEIAEEYFRNADAFVLASRNETFGVVFIEALATGLPVIGTACGGPEDIIDPGNGLLVPVDDAKSLADAMKCIYTNANTYDREHISHIAREKYSPQTIGQQIIEIFEELMK